MAVLHLQGVGQLDCGGGEAGGAGLDFLDRPPLGQPLRVAVLLHSDEPLAQFRVGDGAIDRWRVALDDLRQAAFRGAPALGAGDVDAGVGGALELQQALAHRPAVVYAAHQVADRGDGVLEQGLVEGRGAGDQADGAHLHAGLVHIHQDQADALMLGCLRVGAHQHEDVVAIHGVGGPDLAPVDEEAVAVAHRPRGEAGQVRAGAGFGVAHGPTAFTPGDAGQPAGLLLVVAVFQQGGAYVVDAAPGQRRARPDALQFADEHLVLGLVQLRAAVSLGPGGDGPALVGHAFKPQPNLRRQFDPAAAPGDLAGAAGAGRAVGLQPGAGVLAKFLKAVHLGNGLLQLNSVEPILRTAARSAAGCRC